MLLGQQFEFSQERLEIQHCRAIAFFKQFFNINFVVDEREYKKRRKE